MKFTKNPKNYYKQMKKSVKEGEVLVVPMDNRLMEDIKPYKSKGKNLPSWFKLSPKSGVRKCAGIADYLETGFILPAWTDFSFTPLDNGTWDVRVGDLPFAVMPFGNEGFSKASVGKCPMTDIRKMEEGQFPKLVNPYLFITHPGWSLMVTGMLHEPNENYDIVPGVVHTDYYHQLNIVFNLKGNEPFAIRYGEPLAHLVPLKRSGDIQDIKFANESDFKYAFHRGIGNGPSKFRTNESIRFYRKFRDN